MTCTQLVMTRVDAQVTRSVFEATKMDAQTMWFDEEIQRSMHRWHDWLKSEKIWLSVKKKKKRQKLMQKWHKMNKKYLIDDA